MDTAHIVLTALLALSEVMPFFTMKSNGIAHFFLVCLTGVTNALKDDLQKRSRRASVSTKAESKEKPS